MLATKRFRHARLVVSGLLGVVSIPLLIAGMAVNPAHADAPYVAWSAYLPGWTEEYVPSSDNDCVAGRPACLKQTRQEFGRILKENAQNCTHASVFALAYTRITQTYASGRRRLTAAERSGRIIRRLIVFTEPGGVAWLWLTRSGLR